jgi:outer membrane autotransporter protein
MSTSKNPGWRARRLAALLGGTALIGFVAGQPARAVTINDQIAAQVGGVANYWDQTNVYSNVVRVQLPGGRFCTGTLVNSRTILTAAHCMLNNNGGYNGGALSVSFSPDTRSNINPRVTVSTAILNAYHPSGNDSRSNDIALLSLSTPITNITPAKLLTANPGTAGFPQAGDGLIVAGYGRTGTGLDTSAPDGKRRAAQTVLAGYFPERTLTSFGVQPNIPNECTTNSNCLVSFGQGTQPFFAAQFRNPQNPAQFNYFNLNATLPTLQGGTSAGDSGGPVFWCPYGAINTCRPDQLVEIGELFGGANPSGGRWLYGHISEWTPLNLFAAWIAQNNPQRLVSANSGNFNWSNPGGWSDSVLGQTNFAPNNAVFYNRASGTDPSENFARYYQVILSNPGTITLDMNPTVDTLTIAGAQSQLVLPSGLTLSTVLSTTLAAGTLAMAGGTLSSPEVLISGGLLTGTGTIVADGGNTGLCATGVCNTGGTVMPVGTLTVEGNYTQTGGALAYQLTPSSASGTLAVTGTAALGGTLAATVTPGLYANTTRYSVVVTANPVIGQFAQVASSSVFLPAAATYNPTSVDLTLNRIPFGAVSGLSGNQRAVGNALESSYSTSLSGQQAAFYGNILASATTNVLTQLSGESNAGAGQIAGFQLTNQFLLLMLNPFGQDRSGFGAASSGPTGGLISRFAPERETAPDVAQAYAAVTPDTRIASHTTPRWNVWASAFGGASNTNGDPAGAGTHSFAARTGGMAAGLDYKVTPDTLLGFALAGGDTSWGLAQGLGGGHSDAFQAGLYGSQLFGAAYLSGALAFANYWTATSRGVMVASIDTLNASFDAQSWAGRAEAGYKVAWAPVNLTPYAAVQAQSFHTPGFTESSSSGSKLYALNYASHTGSVTRAELGSWLSNNYLLAGDAVAVVFGRAAWAHDWQENLQAAATFLTVPTAGFIVNSAKPASNLAVVTAGTELRLAQGISLMAKFDGELGAGTHTYTGTARVRYSW